MPDASSAAAVDLLAHREGDAVAVAVHDLRPGEAVVGFLDSGGRREVAVRQEVPLGHKVALVDLREGSEVKEYGERIGLASKDISTGEHVHVHNLRSARWQPAA